MPASAQRDGALLTQCICKSHQDTNTSSQFREMTAAGVGVCQDREDPAAEWPGLGCMVWERPQAGQAPAMAVLPWNVGPEADTFGAEARREDGGAAAAAGGTSMAVTALQTDCSVAAVLQPWPTAADSDGMNAVAHVECAAVCQRRAAVTSFYSWATWHCDQPHSGGIRPPCWQNRFSQAPDMYNADSVWL